MRIARTKKHFGLIAIGFALIAQGPAKAQNYNAEIFLGNDKDVGHTGTTYSVAEGSNDLEIPTENMQPGAYLMSVRVQDGQGVWTPTVSRMIYISSDGNVKDAEYFIDADPGVGKGAFVAGLKNGAFDLTIPTNTLAPGPHTLTVHALDAFRQREAGISRSFIVKANNSEIEWFFDEDPGIGNGNSVSAENGNNVLLLPTAMLNPGAHLLSVRAKDSKNRWTTTVTHPLYVVESVEDVEAGEYFIDEDPGEGYAVSFGVDSDGSSSFVIPSDNLDLGIHYLTLRAKTASGKWVMLHVAPFEVCASGGVQSIEWKMSFNARREGSSVIIEGKDIPAGSFVDVVSISGRHIYQGQLSGDNGLYHIPVADSERNVVVSITSPDGVRTVKRIQ